MLRYNVQHVGIDVAVLGHLIPQESHLLFLLLKVLFVILIVFSL